MQMKLIIYALGKFFRHNQDKIDWSKVVAVSDRDEHYEGESFPKPFIGIDSINTVDFDYIVVFSDKFFDSIRMYLVWEKSINSDSVISWRFFLQFSDKGKLIYHCLKRYRPISDGMTILDLGKINMPKYFLTKEDIHPNANIKLIKLKNGKGYSKILYDGIYGELGNDIKIDVVICGDVEDCSVREIEEICQFSNMLIFVTTYKYYSENKAIRDYLTKYGVVKSIFMVEGICWVVEIGKNNIKDAKDIALYVVMHKDYNVKCNKPYIPLSVGGYSNPKYVSEKNGDNISYLNEKLNECTAMYWIWKNSHSEYVGLNHYRRYFYRNSFFSIDNIVERQDIEKILKIYDIILPNTWHTKDTVKQVLEESMSSEIFSYAYSILREIIKDRQNSYLQAFDDVMNGHSFFPCNLFIAKKEIFNKYCEWLFSYIVDAAELIDVHGLDFNDKRVMGFLAERMLTVWLWNNSFKIKQLPIVSPAWFIGL